MKPNYSADKRRREVEKKKKAEEKLRKKAERKEQERLGITPDSENPGTEEADDSENSDAGEPAAPDKA